METRLKEVFAFVNNKGGVAKTTSVQNVAAGMLRKNPALRILVIDLDPQCNLSSLMNWSSYQDDITVYDSLIAADADPLPSLHVYQSEPGLYFLPASPKLADIERALNTQMQPKLALSTILGSPLHLHSNTQGATTQGATTQEATVLGDFVAEPPLSLDDKLDILEEQLRINIERIDEYRGILHTRRHLAASPIFKGIPDFRQTRIAMLRANTADELLSILEHVRHQYFHKIEDDINKI